jgi:hypothetical protein
MPNSPGDAPAAAEALKPLERDQVSSALSKQDPGQRHVRPPIARRDQPVSSHGTGILDLIVHRFCAGPGAKGIGRRRCMRARSHRPPASVARRVGAGPVRGLAEVLTAATEIARVRPIIVNGDPAVRMMPFPSGPDAIPCRSRDQAPLAVKLGRPPLPPIILQPGIASTLAARAPENEHTIAATP